MDVLEAIAGRKSIRGFKPTPVPKGVLEEVLNVALRAPSANNTQPWEIVVVGGAVLDEIRRAKVELLRSGGPVEREFEPTQFQGVYRQRQLEMAAQLYTLIGIGREDKEKRAEWRERGLRFYDAPAALFLLCDKSLPLEKMAFDIGCLCQTICLAALAFGLGTCIARQGALYPSVVRRLAGIPDSKWLVISICIGYPDWDCPANSLASRRATQEEIVFWHGFATDPGIPTELVGGKAWQVHSTG